MLPQLAAAPEHSQGCTWSSENSQGSLVLWSLWSELVASSVLLMPVEETPCRPGDERWLVLSVVKDMVFFTAPHEWKQGIGVIFSNRERRSTTDSLRLFIQKISASKDDRDRRDGGDATSECLVFKNDELSWQLWVVGSKEKFRCEVASMAIMVVCCVLPMVDLCTRG